MKIKMTEPAQLQYNALLNAALEANKKRQSDSAPKKFSHQEKHFKTVLKTLELMQMNIRHPNLETHKYDEYQNPFDASKPVFEAYVQNNTPGAYRVFWVYGPKNDEITILAITPHP